MSHFTRLSAVFLALFLWQANAHADLDHIKKAAEAGDAERQLELGILYEYGFNYKGKNQVPALTWYMLAAEQGLAKAAKLRDSLQAKLNPSQVEEARAEAERLKKSMTFKPAPVVEPEPESKLAPAVMPTEEKPADAEPTPATNSAPAPTLPSAAAPTVPKTRPSVTPVPAASKPATPTGAAPATTPPPASPAATTTPAPRTEALATSAPASPPAAEQPK